MMTEFRNIENVNGMFQASYMFAETPVSICSVYEDVHAMCADYRTENKPVINITTSKEEILKEKKRNGEEGDVFDDSYIETLLVYRKLAMSLMNHGILLMHGSAIAVDGEGYLFTALSGTGKSTHTRLWRGMLGERAVMINDDKPLIRVSPSSAISQRPIIYGTPWDGKHHLSSNIAVPLKAIIYLERGEHNEIHALPPADIFPILLQQTFRENDKFTTAKILALLSCLTQTVKFYDLHCNMSPDAARVAYEGMQNDNS